MFNHNKKHHITAVIINYSVNGIKLHNIFNLPKQDKYNVTDVVKIMNSAYPDKHPIIYNYSWI